MKKNKKVLTVFAITLALAACVSQKKAAYEFPDAMKKPIQEQYAVLAEKGKILYGINCSGCHNIKVHGKTIIPDFNPAKLVGYELRVQNGQHEAAMPDTKVTAEELALISTFLTYKKKSGIEMVKKS